MVEINGLREKIEESLRILIVDDEPNIVSSLKRELRGQPWPVDGFTDPREALEAARDGTYSLIVSDNLMPEMTGLEMLAEVQRCSPLTGRILLTGRTDLNDALAAFNAGTIHRFVAKPWKKQELLAYVHEALERFRTEKMEQVTAKVMVSHVRRGQNALEETRLELKQAQTQLELHKLQRKPESLLFPPNLRQMAYLVVDEHEGVRDSIVTTLRKAGVSHCWGASGGPDALSSLGGGFPIDVVLTEWAMEQMDGLTFLNAVRARADIVPQPLFVVITSVEHRRGIDAALRGGVDGYIVKPFQLSTLIGQLNAIVQKSQRTGLQQRFAPLRSLPFLVANADMQSRFELQNMLLAGGVKTVHLTESGRAVARLIPEKQVRVLIYDCNLKPPYWLELDAELEAAGIDLSSLVRLFSSVSPVPQEQEEARKAGLPLPLAWPFTRKDLYATVIRHADDAVGLPQQVAG